MASSPDPIRAEDCRHEVRHHLALRSTLALDAAAIRRSLARQHDYAVDEIQAALTFLAGLGQVASRRDALGSTEYWQITAEGTLAEERGD